jgi:S-phase kinase-associated protein 1
MSTQVTFLSTTGDSITLDRRAAEMSATVRGMLEDVGEDAPIPLPNVTTPVLQQVVDYMRWMIDHGGVPNADGSSEFERSFIDCENEQLFDLIMAANYMEIHPLLELTCRAVAQKVRGKAPEEIRQIFNIENDFTPEEEDAIRKENEWCQER